MISHLFTALLAGCLGMSNQHMQYSPDKSLLFYNSQPVVLQFPQGFLKGVARSFYQDGGHNEWNGSPKPYSNWSAFEDSTLYGNARGISPFKRSPIKDGQKIGASSHAWQKAFDDIALLKELGCNAQRFSIEWADIEPEEGNFNEACLNFYADYCDELIAQGITPMVTLHHFVHPNWFEKKGGFLEEENIKYFVRYAQKVFERLGNKVQLWGTINEPNVSTACGYVLGIHPPGILMRFDKAGLVLKHLMQAHVATYKALKQMPHGQNAQIGIVHQLFCCEPYHYKLPGNIHFKHPVGILAAQLLDHSFAHETLINFYKTGHFKYRSLVPYKVIEFNDPEAPNCFDFIGLNFYSKIILGFGPTYYNGQIKTDMDYAVRPDIMYESIKEMADLGKPIYITETGVADKDDAFRADFIQSYMNAIYQAVQNGYDVRGIFYWSLLDNFEWNDGFDMKFGLYKVDSQTQERTLRDGSKVYRDYVTVEKQHQQ